MNFDHLKFCRYGLEVRLVEISDASFINNLRSDNSLNKYLNSSPSSVENQVEWIQKYKEREKRGEELYFIFLCQGVKLGVERIYNITEDAFTFGSLVFDVSAPFGASILADIIVKEIGFDVLKKKLAYFDVRTKNKTVVIHHLKYDPILINEDENNFYYVLDKKNFEENKNKFLKIFKKNE